MEELRHVLAVPPEEEEVDGESRDQYGRSYHGVVEIVHELGHHQQVAYGGEQRGHHSGELHRPLNVGFGEPPQDGAGDRDGHGEPVDERIIIDQLTNIIPPCVHERHQAQQQ